MKGLRDKINKVFAASTGVLVASSCVAAPNDAGFRVPYTNVRFLDLLFSNDLPQHYFTSRTDGYRICRNSEIPDDGRNSIIRTVLGTDSMGLGDDESCKITILEKMDMSFKYDVQIRKNKCDFYFDLSADDVEHIYVVGNQNNIIDFDKCKYRIGLFATGFNGALDIDDEQLFVPRSESFWAHLSDGPKFLPVIQVYFDLCDFELKLFESRQEAVDASTNVSCRRINEQEG